MREILAGKYVLEREIGRGGMGIVWMAYDQQLKRRVAVKAMAPERITSASARARFEHEARAIAQLYHPHVVQIHDYCIGGDSPFIVMELLEGEDIESLTRRKKQFSFEETLNVVRQAAKGLAAAHDAGLIHCDLKPANLFLARKGGEEVIKILDFGVAAMLESEEMTERSGFAGTPAYMSPEQVRASHCDHRSDLWSLGVIAYRMLTGQLPFEAPGLPQLIMKICGGSPRLPSTLVADLPTGIDSFFARALATDPALRFGSAHEMAAAFAVLGHNGPHRPIKLLVVDDEPDIIELIRYAFRPQIRASVYSFLFASDGDVALDVLRNNPDVDIVLTDLHMPRMNGLTLLGHIPEVNPMAKAVVLTAYNDMSNIRTAMNRGAFDFLTKPIDFKDLRATIEKTFRLVEESRKSARFSEENETLRMFVSPSIVRRIKLLGIKDVVANEPLDATVAFIGIHSFDEVKTRAGDIEAVKMLNANFDVIIPEVMARHGAVERFLSDVVMAVFAGDEHERRAVEACVAVRSQLQELARRAGDESPYACGLSTGIAAGRVLATGIGSVAFRRLDHALIGDVVSIAAQLRKLAARDEILVEKSIYERAKDTVIFDAMGEAAIIPGGDPICLYNAVNRVRMPAELKYESTLQLSHIAKEQSG